MGTPRARALAVLAAALAVSAPSLGGGWVMDDPMLVRVNPALERPADIPLLFVRPYWYPIYGSGNYRPAALASLAIERPAWRLVERAAGIPEGEWAGGHRVTNWLLHGACAVLFLGLATRLAGERPGLFAALAWAVLPVNQENLAHVVMRTTLLSGLFMLLFLRGMLARAPARGGRAWLLALWWLLASMSKEGAIVAPAAGLALVGLLPAPERPGRLRPLALPLLAAAAVFFGLRAIAVGVDRPYTAYAEHGPGLADRLPSILRGLAWSHRILPWPLGLSAMHPLPDPGGIPAASTLAAAAALALLAALALRRPGVVRSAALFFWANLLPVSNLALSIGVEKGARFLYAASLGPALAAGALLASLPARRSLPPAALAAALLALLSLRTAGRWSDGASILTESLRSEPVDPVLRAHRARRAIDAGHPRRGLAEAGLALRRGGIHEVGFLAIQGRALTLLARPADARATLHRAYDRAAAFSASPAEILDVLEESYWREGDLAAGARDFEGIASRRPGGHPSAWLPAGRLLEGAGRPAEARAAFERYLEALPQGPGAAFAFARLRAIGFSP